METGNRKEFSCKDIQNFGGIKTKVKKKRMKRINTSFYNCKHLHI